jgi:DNA-binding protein H-NS
MNNELSQIDQQIAELVAKKQSIITSQRQDALTQAKQLIAQFGFSASDLGIEKRMKDKTKTAKVAPKYRNPANPDETWTGRGKAPAWAKVLKQEGRLDSTLI